MSANQSIQYSRVLLIVVHCTHTRQEFPGKLDFNYIITPDGKLHCVNPVTETSCIVEIAWVGGVDEQGMPVDNRTKEQSETLMNTLLLLSEYCPYAEILPACEITHCAYPDPGFDLKAWMKETIQRLLRQ